MQQIKKTALTFPNLLSALRLVLGIVLLGIAWRGNTAVFIGILVFAFFLDFIDGPIARRWQQVSELGSTIDSYADFSVYMAFLIGAWWLWPEIVQRELLFISLLGLSIVLPALVGLIKFRRATSYHTWLVKIAVVCMAPGSILLFVGGPAWPFQIATIISVAAGLEEIAISLLLEHPRADIRSVFDILAPGTDP
jgi:CDP-diacylglycerol--glycerol-3-phosphate 3-phosphatidyltransferase